MRQKVKIQAKAITLTNGVPTQLFTNSVWVSGFVLYGIKSAATDDAPTLNSDMVHVAFGDAADELLFTQGVAPGYDGVPFNAAVDHFIDLSRVWCLNITDGDNVVIEFERAITSPLT